MTPTSNSMLHLVDRALNNNTECASGLLAPRRVFTTPQGPSGGPELLALVRTDDRWGSLIWYGHVFRHPDTGKYLAGLFYSHKLINGATEDILFKRLYHWTVINPKSGAAISQQNGDAFAEHSSFEAAVSTLSKMIEGFDRRARTIGVEQHNVANSTEDRLLQAYEDWGLGNESMDAFPVPPDTPGNCTTKPSKSMRYPKPVLVETTVNNNVSAK